MLSRGPQPPHVIEQGPQGIDYSTTHTTFVSRLRSALLYVHLRISRQYISVYSTPDATMTLTVVK